MTPPRPATRPELMILLAHQDDECFAWGAIDHARHQGQRVTCLLLTAGDAYGQCPVRRNAESRAALAEHGVLLQPDDLIGTRLAIPDGRLVKHLEAAFQAVLRRLGAADRDNHPGSADSPHAEGLRSTTSPLGPACLPRLLIPAWEGGHADHDAAHLVGLAVARACGTLARTAQFSLYHGAGLPGPFYRCRAPLPANGPGYRLPVTRRRCLRTLFACRHYRSQWRVFVGLLPLLAWAALRRPAQVLQPVSLQHVYRRPHAGRLFYERSGRTTFATFMQTAQPFMTRYLAMDPQGVPPCQNHAHGDLCNR